MAKRSKKRIPKLFVVSGGTGASGNQLVQTALAQFEDAEVDTEIIGQVTTRPRLEKALEQVSKARGSIVHTLVDDPLRRELMQRARELNVPQIDAMGRVVRRLSTMLGREPLAQPGRYRKLHHAYFDRVAAIEFSVRHDDGQQPEGLEEADMVLVGVSRTGKTPLAMYLSVQGWKVANVPFVAGIPLPEELADTDRRRVVGLVIDPTRLMRFRQPRANKLKMGDEAGYADNRHVREEVAASERVFRRRGYTLFDVTDKPIEASADELLARVGERLAKAPTSRRKRS